MADGGLNGLEVLLEKIRSEIAINEVYLKGKVEQTEFIRELAKIRKEYDEKLNKLLIKVAVLATIVAGTGWLL